MSHTITCFLAMSAGYNTLSYGNVLELSVKNIFDLLAEKVFDELIFQKKKKKKKKKKYIKLSEI